MRGEKVTDKDPLKEPQFPYRISFDGDLVYLTIELPGIGEEKIRLDLDRTTLVVSTADQGRVVRMPIGLPWEARLGTKAFRKGVLELTLERSGR
jgi:HSP20 family molecular chaperone IbpA